MNRLSIALRFLQRDARHGELTLLVLALVIAVTSSTAISLFADRLHRTMNSQAAEFLAADLVVTSPVVIPNAWLSKADKLGLNKAYTAEFSTVLIENDELLLAGIKAVSEAYPLRGHLKTKDAPESTSVQQIFGPEVGRIWVDNRVLTTLKLSMGDEVTIGEKTLTVSHIITYEPDKRGDIYSLSPRVLMNEADLPATKVLEPGSRVHYFFQFSGEPTAISSFNQWVKPQLTVSQRVMDVQDDRPELGSALSRAERYLGLSSILVVLIAGVAIAMSSRRFTERHFNSTAIMRCMGCKQNDMVMIFLYQFIIMGLLACSIGLLQGWFAQEVLFDLLRSLLPAKVSAPSMMAVMFGFVTGFTILIGFALPPLLRLKRVSPLRVLRRELDPINNSSWFVYGIALLLVAGLVLQYTNDLKLMLTVIGGGVFAIVLSGGLIFVVLKQLRRLLPHLSLGGRLGFQGLLSNPTLTTVQIMAFSITLVAMLLSFTVRNDLLSDWQQQLPNDAPNYFALNIFPSQIDSFEQQLEAFSIPAANIYPVVRGRLVEINGEPVQRHVTKESQGERAIHRDLSLTWGNDLPVDNKTLAGSWGQAKKGEVSIESKLALSLKVVMGDELTFTIGSEQVKAVVSHIRSVQWDTMKPNFYMVFSKETLEGFPATYITSFFLSEANKKRLNALVKQFPAMTVLEVDAMLKQIKMILNQLTAAITYLLYFALIAGFTVLFSSVYSTLDNRISEGALMRTLGANRALLRKAQLVEFSMIGLITGIIAVLMSQLVLFGLYNYVLQLEFKLDVLLCVIVPILSMLVVVIAGLWGVKDVVKKSPMVVLKAS